MKVERIDHVHVEVRDREAGADWYARVLGLRRDGALAAWAEEPQGPLILSAGDGRPALALFEREVQEPSRDSTVAFRTTGAAFLDFLDRLPELALKDREGQALTAAHVVDHDLCWSLYFIGPDDNRIELTTYDYAVVCDRLR